MSQASTATRFKAGNIAWQGRRSPGRKPIFASPEALSEACEGYFDWCDNNPLMIPELVKYQGKARVFHMPKMRPFTMIGMCSHLGISRQTWTHYRRKPDFFDTCEWAECVIYVQRFEGAAAGIVNASIIGREIRPGGSVGVNDTPA